MLIDVFKLHVPVFFWPSRYKFRDIELKFCIFSQLASRKLATKFENSGLKNRNMEDMITYKISAQYLTKTLRLLGQKTQGHGA